LSGQDIADYLYETEKYGMGGTSRNRTELLPVAQALALHRVDVSL